MIPRQHLHHRPATGCVRDRAHPRLKVFQPARMLIAETQVRAHLLDISFGGARIHCAAAGEPDDPVLLSACAVTARGRVVWRRGDRIGVRFDRLLGEEEIARLTA